MMKFSDIMYENVVKEYMSFNYIRTSPIYDVKLIRHEDFSIVWFLLKSHNNDLLISLYETDLISPRQLIKALQTQLDAHYSFKEKYV